MSDSEKIPVTIYQLDRLLFGEAEYIDIVETVIKRINKAGGRYTNEELRVSRHKDYQVTLFSSSKTYQPKWRSFLAPMLAEQSRLNSCQNQTQAFICLIGYEQQIYAVTGGYASFDMEPIISQNFGLEILVRLVEKDSKVIKSIQDRGVTGIVLGQTKFYRGDQRLSDEDQFGKIFKQVSAELSTNVLTKILGFDKGDLKRKVSGCLAKASFRIGKSIDFDNLLSLIKRFTEILQQKEKFTLNKVQLISKKSQNAIILRDLNEQFTEKLYNDYQLGVPLNVDFCHPDFEKYLLASCFTIHLEQEEDIQLHNPTNLQEVIRELQKKDQYLDEDIHQFRRSVLDRIIETTDENGASLTTGSVLQHLHGEMVYQNKTFFLVEGEWYQIHPNFIKDLNEECLELLKQSWDTKLITETFDVKKRESIFNQQFVGKKGWLVFDTITPENIELCDILHYNQEMVHLVHVKKGFDNSIRELAAQVSISAKRLQRTIKSNPAYFEDLEQQTKRGSRGGSIVMNKLAGQVFPQGGLKEIFSNKLNIQIVFCLAFVDTTQEKRSLKEDLSRFASNIAKYSLIELRKEIISMGFGFKVIQLMRL